MSLPVENGGSRRPLWITRMRPDRRGYGSAMLRVRGRCAVALAALAMVCLAGCVPEPAPSPTPTGFASDEEAFRAAEATYRAYVDAVNARRQSPDSRPAPDDFLVGAALESSIKAQRRFAEEGIRLVGTTQVHTITPQSASLDHVVLQICIDSSETRVLDEKGNDVTPADRDDVGGLEVDFVWATPAPLISESRVSADTC